MNEKIKELRKQAIIEKIEHFSWGEPAITRHLDEEKFAELIILKCAEISEDNFRNGFAGARGMKNHFGVQ